MLLSGYLHPKGDGVVLAVRVADRSLEPGSLASWF